MSDALAMRIRNVTKTYRVHTEKNNTLKDKLIYAGRARYKEFVALKDVTFDVPVGSTVGLIGTNGSGKSTLLKLISRIMEPDSGSIEVNGRISSLLELGAGFHPDFTGRENIFLNASLMGLSKKEIRSKLDDIITFSELGDFLDEPLRSYSSGMYMRLAFSVAVAVDPEILLLDEVLAVGDAAFQAKCMTRLRRLQSEGKTIVLVTHDPGTVERFCDQAVWLDNAKIAMIGDPRDCVREYIHKSFDQSGGGSRSMTFERDPAETGGTNQPEGVVLTGQENVHARTVLVNGKIDEVATVEPLQPCEFILSIESAEDVEGLTLHCDIHGADGGLVWHSVMGESNQDSISLVSAMELEVQLNIERLSLAEGEYTVTFKLMSIDGVPVAEWLDVKRLNVMPIPLQQGTVTMVHKWTLSNKSADVQNVLG